MGDKLLSALRDAVTGKPAVQAMAVQAVVAVALAIGFHLTPDQVVAVLGGLAVVLGPWVQHQHGKLVTQAASDAAAKMTAPKPPA